MVSWYFIPELDRPKHLGTGGQPQALPVSASSLTARQREQQNICVLCRQADTKEKGGGWVLMSMFSTQFKSQTLSVGRGQKVIQVLLAWVLFFSEFSLSGKEFTPIKNTNMQDTLCAKGKSSDSKDMEDAGYFWLSRSDSPFFGKWHGSSFGEFISPLLSSLGGDMTQYPLCFPNWGIDTWHK